jgi:hypothetical protein
LPPDSRAKLSRPKSFEPAPHLEGSVPHRFKPKLWIGIEVYDKPVGGLDRRRPAAPAVELDRLHLRAGEDAGCIRDVEIVFGATVFLGHLSQPDRGFEVAARGRVGAAALEEALLLAAAQQVEEPAFEMGEHHRRNDLIIERRRAHADVRLRERRLFGPDHLPAAALLAG